MSQGEVDELVADINGVGQIAYPIIEAVLVLKQERQRHQQYESEKKTALLGRFSDR